MSQKQANYIDQYSDLAVDQMRKYGIPASVILAQGLLESAAGTSSLAVNDNNHFGIKVSPAWLKEGGGYSVHSDDTPNDRFCTFSSVAESYEYHSRFLKENSRYSRCFTLKPDDYAGWTDELQRQGYASDPKYSSKLQSIIQQYGLDRFDRQAMAAGLHIGSAEPVGQSESQVKYCSFPLDRADGIFQASSLFGAQAQDGSVRSSLDILSDGEQVLCPERGAEVTSVTSDSVSLQMRYDDGTSSRVTYGGLKDIGVKAGDVLAAGDAVGISSGTLEMSVRFYAADGRSYRDIDPAAYMADLADGTGQKAKIMYEGKDILEESLAANSTAARDVPRTPQQLLEDSILSGNIGAGEDSLLAIIVRLFASLIALAAASEREERDLAEKTARTKTLDLKGLVPDTDECRLDIREDGSVRLRMTSSDIAVDRDLTPGELSRLSILTGSPSLSDETKKGYVSQFLGGILSEARIASLSQNMSDRFDEAYAQSQQQDLSTSRSR